MNAIPIRTWMDDPLDTELKTLSGILEKLANVNDIPKVLLDLKKRKMTLSAASIHELLNSDRAEARGYYNSPVNLKGQKFRFEDS